MSTRSKSSWRNCFNENRWSSTWFRSLLFKDFQRERCLGTRLLRRTFIGLTFPKYVQKAKSIQSIACTFTSTHDVKHQAPTTLHSFQWKNSFKANAFVVHFATQSAKLRKSCHHWTYSEPMKGVELSGDHVTSSFVAQNETGRLLRHENESGRFICFFFSLIEKRFQNMISNTSLSSNSFCISTHGMCLMLSNFVPKIYNCSTTSLVHSLR